MGPNYALISIRHGFVETSFGSQGRTVRRVLLGMSSASLPATNQEAMYVSSSRAKERMTLYTDDKAEVRHAVQRSSRKLAALDLKATAAAPSPHLRREMRHKHRLAYGRMLASVWAKAKSRLRRPAAPAMPPAFVEHLTQLHRNGGHER